MSAYYQRTISVDAARDTSLTKKFLERDELQSLVTTYEEGLVITGTLDAAMGAPDTVFDGASSQLANAQVIYLEYTGVNLDILITDSNGEATFTLNATTEKVLLIEGLTATVIKFQNTDGTEEADFFMALLGDSA